MMLLNPKLFRGIEFALAGLFCFFISCSSPENKGGTLGMDPNATPPSTSLNDEGVLSPVEGGKPSDSMVEKPSEAYLKLTQLLQTLGYEPLGMQFEDETTLNLLFQVFSDDRAKNRELKLVYTGLKMDYDKNHQSLTVGSGTELSAVLVYISKNVPLKGAKTISTVPPKPDHPVKPSAVRPKAGNGNENGNGNGKKATKAKKASKKVKGKAVRQKAKESPVPEVMPSSPAQPEYMPPPEDGKASPEPEEVPAKKIEDISPPVDAAPADSDS